MCEYKSKYTQLGSEEYQKTHKVKNLPEGNEWVFETSMTTMMSYVHRTGISMITAFRGDSNFKQNIKRHELLKSQFRKKDIKVIEVDGEFIENYKTNQERRVEELTLAIPFFPEYWQYSFTEERKRSDVPFISDKDMTPLERFTYYILKIGSIFNQDCVVIAHPSLGVYLHYRTGEKVKIGTKATPDKIGEAYTRLRHGTDKSRTFIFEGTRSPHNHIDAYRLKAEGILF